MVARDAARVPECGDESDDAGEPVAVSKTVRSWSEAGHAQQYRGVVVFGDFLADQHVQVGQFLVQGDDVLCEGGDRDCGVLGSCGVEGGLGNPSRNVASSVAARTNYGFLAAIAILRMR